MMYTRASASDYDDWEKVHENPGWGSNELIPLLRKVCDTRQICAYYIYPVRLSPMPALRQRRSKLPMVDQRTAPTAHSKFPQVDWSLISENSSFKSPAPLIPHVPRRRLTPIRTIYLRSMYTPWV